METPKTDTPNKPSDPNLAAAYQVTARCFANQAQVLWRAIGLFVTVNALVVGLLHFVPTLPDFVRVVLPLAGFGYSVGWHYAMRRLWTYHDAYIRIAREQEAALQLSTLGPFSRVNQICNGGRGATIGGDHTQFWNDLKLRYLFTAIIWSVAITYAAFLFDAGSRMEIPDTPLLPHHYVPMNLPIGYMFESNSLTIPLR